MPSGTLLVAAMASAMQRAANYLQQAAHFRQLAETEENDRLHGELLRLAQEYEQLAKTLGGEPTVPRFLA